MKKLLLILVVTLAFATTSSYAWTYSDNYGARIFVSDGNYEYFSVMLPSGYGHSTIFYAIDNSLNESYSSIDSAGGGDSLSSYGFKRGYLPYYAGTMLYFDVFAGLGGWCQICASYY
ncbi:MAG TPA: hypothetical protein VHO50_14180 [Bacteroidales bacterium]|nr:hypothetical protein [Bacteroidales bacterium]